MPTSLLPVGPAEPIGERLDAVSPVSAARAVTRAARLLSFALVLGAAVSGAHPRGFPLSLYWAFAFAGTATALSWLLPVIADRGLSAGGLEAEVGSGNVAAAVAGAGNRLAVGVILSSCLYGATIRDLLVSLAFVPVAFLSFVCMQWLYRVLTRYADDAEIRDRNVAAALCYAGVTLAFGIIIGHATDGHFSGWSSSLARYAAALLLAFLLYPVRQIVVCRLLLGLPAALRGGALDRAVAQERNAVIGAVEGTAYVATALLVTGLVP